MSMMIAAVRGKTRNSPGLVGDRENGKSQKSHIPGGVAVSGGILHLFVFFQTSTK